MENMVLAARSRLASLWLSHVSRVMADNCLRIFVLLQVARAGQEQAEAAMYQVTPFLICPFILLAPVNGAISNSLSKRWVLAGSAAFCLALTVLFGALLGADANAWLWCLALALVAVGHAVYSPTRYAVLPAAARDAAVPLSRVMGWIEMGSVAGTIAGMVLGWYLHDVPWLWDEHDPRSPMAVFVAVALNLVGLLAALPVRFASDVHRAEPARQALTGFFRDGRRILQDAEACASLLGLACFLGLVAAGAGARIASAQSPEVSVGQRALPQAMLLVGVGVALGSLLAGVQGHPRRALGLVPFGALGLLAALIWAATSADPRWSSLAFGVMGGLINVPLRAAYLEAVPADARGNGMSLMNATNYVCMSALPVLLYILGRFGTISATGQFWLLAGLAAVGASLVWRALLRECFEQVLELLIWPFYRIHARGPGLCRIPQRGPVLLVANHSSWFDPVWLGKVIPRRLTAMMTSRFFDLPVLHWLLTHVARTIRVEAARFRREAPELQEAVAALDRGECVLIFPEAYMKRKREQSLRQFGQGVWRILRERPATPVVVCWIEGGWGSFASYFNGPPTVNKRLDWWRPIDIAVDTPHVLDPALLADQRATRTYLMRACLGARRYLGLEPLPLQQTGPEEVVQAD